MQHPYCNATSQLFGVNQHCPSRAAASARDEVRRSGVDVLHGVCSLTIACGKDHCTGGSRWFALSQPSGTNFQMNTRHDRSGTVPFRSQEKTMVSNEADGSPTGMMDSMLAL